MQEIVINIFNIAGSSLCVDSNDGEKVYELIKKAFNKAKKIKLSFQNIEMITSAFLNTAIGQLYRDFSEEEIKNKLSVDKINPEDKLLLKRVIATAKNYYKNPDKLEKSINQILEEE